MPAQMVFTMGLPAAGKTTIAAQMFPSPEWTHIDCDAIKATHPAYDPKDPGAIHEWSKQIEAAQYAAALASASGCWVIDGTGTGAEKLVKQIREAKAVGFAVRLVYVKCSLATSLRRNAARERVVPTHIITEKADLIETSFGIVAPCVDDVTVLHND